MGKTFRKKSFHKRKREHGLENDSDRKEKSRNECRKWKQRKIRVEDYR